MGISGGIPGGKNGGAFSATGPILLDDASVGGYGTIWCKEEEVGTDWCVATV
ncbi:hypothetical protein TRAPUB_7868 [Trametes pubescens]|uniref:Uncharacterized protein n=1 Tax=Trametes pubescens TaxID=154538 RepID=A0A1M2V275_TRAPU|nr:hypothetical protein TRAPUB_7868 [Trametes pubescens]